jgi:hypothetical protein
MAGGTWTSQNKVRPGAYINFKAVEKSSMTVGDRGIVAIGLPLSWGENGKMIEVLSSDLLDGSSQKLVGFDAFSDDSKILRGALSYAYKALVYRTNSGGLKAKATIGGLLVTAKCNGTFGNSIIIAVSQDSSTSVYTVITYVNGVQADKQTASKIADLESNDYVEFAEDTSGGAESGFSPTAGAALSGGTDGVEEISTAYPAMFKLLKMSNWQTLACLTSDTSIKSNVVSFIEQERDDEGKYVQAVVADYDGADSEGIINSVCGAVIDGVTWTKEEFVAIVAGMTAGANFNESNTAKTITGATSIVDELTDSEIKEALSKGKFVLSTSTSGNIKVEQDINSLHTYSSDRNYNFSKNRVLRTLDEIGTTTKTTWEDTYMGKVDNNETGRALFKADLTQYGNELQRLAGIQEFDGSTDIEISQGNDLDSVLVTWAVKPVDSMEKLYLTCNVNS